MIHHEVCTAHHPHSMPAFLRLYQCTVQLHTDESEHLHGSSEELYMSLYLCTSHLATRSANLTATGLQMQINTYIDLDHANFSENKFYGSRDAFQNPYHCVLLCMFAQPYARAGKSFIIWMVTVIIVCSGRFMWQRLYDVLWVQACKCLTSRPAFTRMWKVA